MIFIIWYFTKEKSAIPWFRNPGSIDFMTPPFFTGSLINLEGKGIHRIGGTWEDFLS